MSLPAPPMSLDSKFIAPEAPGRNEFIRLWKHFISTGCIGFPMGHGGAVPEANLIWAHNQKLQPVRGDHRPRHHEAHTTTIGLLKPEDISEWNDHLEDIWLKTKWENRHNNKGKKDMWKQKAGRLDRRVELEMKNVALEIKKKKNSWHRANTA